MQVFINITKLLLPCIMVLVLVVVPACTISSMSPPPRDSNDTTHADETVDCKDFQTEEIHLKLKNTSVHFYDIRDYHQGRTFEASGVAIGRNLVLTNFHVWRGSGLNENLLIAKDEDLDLAIIEVGLPWDQPLAEIFPGSIRDGKTTWAGGWRNGAFLINKGQSVQIFREIQNVGDPKINKENESQSDDATSRRDFKWIYLSNHSTVPGNSGGGVFVCTWEGLKLTGITSFILGQQVPFSFRPLYIPTFIRTGQIPSYYVFELLKDKPKYLERLENWQENFDQYTYLRNAQKLHPKTPPKHSSNPLQS